MNYFFIATICLSLCCSGLSLTAKETISKFKAQVVPTLDLYASDQWYNILPQRPPLLSVAHDVVVNEFFDITSYFSGLSIKNKKESISYTITIKSPDGKIYYKTQKLNYPGPEDKIKLSSNALFRASNTIRVCFEPKDPKGEYIIELNATDTLTGAIATSKRKIVLLSWDDMQKKLLQKGLKFENALMGYHKSPQPAMLPLLFKQFLTIDTAMRNNKTKKYRFPTHILAFFYFILKQNPFLLEKFANNYKDYNQFGKMYTVLLFSHLGKEGRNMIQKLDKAAINYGETIKDKPSLFEFKTPTVPVQNDILWSKFFATGSIAPIKQLIEATRLTQKGISIKQFKALKQKTKKDRIELFKYLTGTSALWSLKSNIKNQPLVRNYCEYILTNTKDKYTKKVLSSLFKQLQKNQ